MFLIASLLPLLLSLSPASAQVTQSYNILLRSDGECPDACPVDDSEMSSANFEACINELWSGWGDCAISGTMYLSGSEAITPCRVNTSTGKFATMEVALLNETDGLVHALRPGQSITATLNSAVTGGCAYYLLPPTDSTGNGCPVDSTVQISGAANVTITATNTTVIFPLPLYETIAVAVPAQGNENCLNFTSLTYDGIEFQYLGTGTPNGAHFSLSAPVSLMLLLGLLFIKH